MYDYLKPLLKQNPDNIILHVGNNNSVNDTSRDILNEILSLKNFIEKLCTTWKVIVSNLIYRSDNGKASLTGKNVNHHLHALNIDVVDNRNTGGNCLNNSGLHLNSICLNSITFFRAQTNMRMFLIKQLSSIKKKLGVRSVIVASPLKVKAQAMI